MKKNNLGSRNSFTLLEILIVVALIAVLATTAVLLFNPIQQMNKAWNTKRKSDLSQLKKTFEDFYNDKSRYPFPSEVCYDLLSIERIDNDGQLACSCHLCGHNSSSPSLAPYLSLLPCDPQSPSKEYLYDYDCRAGATYPQWVRVYSYFSDVSISNEDSETLNVGCNYLGCGPKPDYGYAYGVSSPNVDLETSNEYAFCSRTGCNVCGDPDHPDTCFNYPLSEFCQQKKRIYGTVALCIADCPCQL